MKKLLIKAIPLVLLTLAFVPGCAKDESELTLKRDRDRLSYQVTDLQNQLDRANAEIERLKAASK